jgi:hypothetical protein
MSSNLTKGDYIKILNFYKVPIPESSKKLKLEAEKLLAEKLCRCIKSVDPKNEPKSIGICTRTIFNKKGLKRGSFKCKKNQNVTFKKNTKTRKNRISKK